MGNINPKPTMNLTPNPYYVNPKGKEITNFVNIHILGEGGVGKTSLKLKFLNPKCEWKDLLELRRVELENIQKGNQKQNGQFRDLWIEDLNCDVRVIVKAPESGQEMRTSTWFETQIMFICFSVVDAFNEDFFDNWKKEIDEHPKDDPTIVFVLTKDDLGSHSGRLSDNQIDEVKLFCSNNDYLFLRSSAQENVDDLFKAAVNEHMSRKQH